MRTEFEWLLLSPAELCAFDNEGDGDAGDGDGAGDAGDGAGDGAGDAGAPAGESAAEQKERLFRQKDVDEIVVKRNKKVNAQLKTLEGNYQKLLQQQGMSDDMRSQLEADLDAVRSEMMTKEEKLKAEKEKAAQQYEEKLSKVQETADFYKEQFETSTIFRSISDAQQKHGGYDADQFIAYLGPKSKVVDEIDGKGEKTGNLVPRIEWNINKEDGTVEQVMLTPEEAVEKMKEQEKFGNMFISNVAKGVGGGTSPGTQSAMTGKIDQKRISDEDYFALRKKDPDAFRRQVGLTHQ